MTSREKNPKSKREKWRQQDVEVGLGGGGGYYCLFYKWSVQISRPLPSTAGECDHPEAVS